ncbi:MAG: LacI family transcriptional regulator, partial [Paenibacillus sp.]|nr:LacI family transcriptional regulator [Paenibacillus sp.]
MITINDVAQKAGVSKATVSLALSDHPRISEKTKTKIRQIAEELGYIPNRLASGLSKAKSRSIGVLFIDTAVQSVGEFFKDTLIGISSDALRQDYNVVLIGLQEHKMEPANLYDTLMRAGVDGAIVISSTPRLNGLEKVANTRFPLVFIGKRTVAGVEPDFVSSDNFGGGKLATDYLIELGHRHIAVVAPPKDERLPTEEDRIHGYFAALRGAGLQADESRIVTIASPYDEADPGLLALEKLQASAFFATSPHFGLALLQHFRQRGVQVPAEKSLIVFDDFPTATLEMPPLTVVKQDMETLGKMATKMLIDSIESPPTTPNHVYVSTRLIKRASCAPPPQ